MRWFIRARTTDHDGKLKSATSWPPHGNAQPLAVGVLTRFSAWAW
jgi:hypothetical protein